MPRLSECGRTAGIAVHNDAGDHQGNESGRCQIDEQVPIVVRVAVKNVVDFCQKRPILWT